jgi:hypothetical protein
MRKSCTYGSERGAPSNGRPYRDRRELSASKKAPWNRHFLHRKCHTPLDCDTLDSSFVRASFDHLVGACE